MRSSPDPATSALFDKHLVLPFDKGEPFGVYDVLCAMEEERWYPCNFMQIDQVFRWRVKTKCEGAGWTEAEQRDSKNAMVRTYGVYKP